MGIGLDFDPYGDLDCDCETSTFRRFAAGSTEDCELEIIEGMFTDKEME